MFWPENLPLNVQRLLKKFSGFRIMTFIEESGRQGVDSTKRVRVSGTEDLAFKLHSLPHQLFGVVVMTFVAKNVGQSGHGTKCVGMLWTEDSLINRDCTFLKRLSAGAKSQSAISNGHGRHHLGLQFRIVAQARLDVFGRPIENLARGDA